MDIKTVIDNARKNNASDIIIKSTGKVKYRVCGKLIDANSMEFSSEDLIKLRNDLYINSKNPKSDYDESILIDDVLYRVSVFKTGKKLNFSIRIPKISLDPVNDLNIPVPISRLAVLEPGITIISGNSNNGKSTTVASILNEYNKYNIHVMTAENPIEFIIKDKEALFSQRKLGIDFNNYCDVIDRAARESVDVIFIHEIDSFETLNSIFNAVESGIHVITTTATNGCILTLKKLVNLRTREYSESWISDKLSEYLHCIMSQTLVPNIDSTERVLATEVLFNKNIETANIIKNQLFECMDDLLCKYSKDGMHTLENDLAKLVKSEKITIKEALGHSINKVELQKLL